MQEKVLRYGPRETSSLLVPIAPATTVVYARSITSDQGNGRRQSSTTPVEPLTTTGVPSAMTLVASRAPSTSGMPNSRATIAA
jgi:hypothetical protein